ncbi:MAG: ATP-grasp domain-containing protein, partial [Acidimicrobiia bacterium]
MPRVLLLVPTATYRAPDFVRAAKALGVELVIGSEEAPVFGESGRSVQLPLDDPDAAVAAIEALDRAHGIDAVVAVDDQGIVAAAAAGEQLGFPHNPADAVAATRDKLTLRARLDASEVPQPAFGTTPDAVGYPCVVKPAGLAASRGVIRCDSAAEYDTAVARIGAFWTGPLIVEQYVPGAEVAVEALLADGVLTVLAIFDKPDPLTGPFFEETIYVTPSRLPPTVQTAIAGLVERAAAAIGLTEGPVHAEVRVDLAAPDTPALHVIEVAARTIGGLCARTLQFGAGISLEEVVLRHALGMDLSEIRQISAASNGATASGVMMLPIP